MSFRRTFKNVMIWLLVLQATVAFTLAAGALYVVCFPVAKPYIYVRLQHDLTGLAILILVTGIALIMIGIAAGLFMLWTRRPAFATRTSILLVACGATLGTLLVHLQHLHYMLSLRNW